MIWGIWDVDWMKGIYEAAKEFERRNPGIKLEILPIGSSVNPQKLLTSIISGNPPDVIRMDRFQVSGWASRGAFLCLDDFIKKSKVIHPQDFYSACWKECVYKNKVYAIPYGVDVRLFYWNKKIFKEVGLDPDRPPQNWKELEEYSKKIVKFDKSGKLLRAGFVPQFGNALLYMYMWQNGGKLLSDDGKKCLVYSPQNIEALKWCVDFQDKIYGGAGNLDVFSASFQSRQFDPFLVGKIAMKIDGNWILNQIAKYKPDFDFGVSLPPSPDGKKRITWSGGHSLVIPKGAKNPELAFKFIEWMVSREGSFYAEKAQKEYDTKIRKFSIYIPPFLNANKKIARELIEKFAPKEQKFRKALFLAVNSLNISKFRPISPISKELSDELSRAMDEAIHKKITPQKALKKVQLKIQAELDKLFLRENYVPFKWNKWVISIMLFFACIVIIYFLYLFISKRIYYYPREDVKWGYVFLLPWLIGITFFTLMPVIASFLLSFCDYDVLHPARWIGFSNYVNLIKNDPLFYKSLWNTMYMAIFGVPLSLVTGLLIAVLLNANLKGITVFRAIFYLPAIVPIVATSLLWLWIFNPDIGLINKILHLLHIPFKPKWLWDENWSKPSLIIMGMWGSGGSMLIWLTGLKSIPSYLYEAAEIDGCNKFQKFFYITLPMLTPYILFNLITGLIGTFQIFAQAYIMTSGGPLDSTLFYVYYLFKQAFEYFNMGYAAALAWILFVIVLIITIIQLYLSKKWVYYD